jgi:cytidylate kinase
VIKILTIEREYGSGAAGIAKKTADRLGWKLWDQLLTDEIARYLECDRRHVAEKEERRDPLYYRLLKAFLRGSHEGSQAAPRMKIADAEGIRHASQKVVSRAAEEGNAVIVGRGSAYYLHERRDAFHVFVYAPFEEKVARLEQEGKSHAEAMDLAQTVDSDRAVFIKQHFGVDWPARAYFHLMVNSTLGEDAAVGMILHGMGGPISTMPA